MNDSTDRYTFGACPPEWFSGRKGECDRIRERITEAGTAGQVILITGKTGIGKSSLLAWIEYEYRTPVSISPVLDPILFPEEESSPEDDWQLQFIPHPAYLKSNAVGRPQNAPAYLTIRKEFFGTSGQIFSTYTQVVKSLQDGKTTRKFAGVFSDKSVQTTLAFLADALNVVVPFTPLAAAAPIISAGTKMMKGGIETAFSASDVNYDSVLTKFFAALEAISRKLREPEYANSRVILLFDNVHQAHGDDLNLLKDLMRHFPDFTRIVLVIAYELWEDRKSRELEAIIHGFGGGKGIVRLGQLTWEDIREFATKRFDEKKIDEAVAKHLLEFAGDPATLVSCFKCLKIKNQPATIEGFDAVREVAINDPVQASLLGIDDPKERDRANRLCILSSPFPLEIAGCLEGLGPLELWGLKEALESSPIFRCVDEEYYDFMAQSIKEYCRAELPRSQKIELNWLAARCFESKLKDLPDRKKAELSLERHCFNAKEYDKAFRQALDLYDFFASANNFPIALELAEHAISCTKELDLPTKLAESYIKKGDILRLCYKYPGALSAYEESCKIYSDLIRYWHGRATARARIGVIYKLWGEEDWGSGNFARALEEFGKSLELFEMVDDLPGEAYVLGLIGDVHMKQGDYPCAFKYHQKSLEIKERLQNKRQRLYGMACTHLDIGVVQAGMYKFKQAEDSFLESGKLCDAAMREKHEAGSEGSDAQVANLKARIPKELGIICRLTDTGRAQAHFNDSLDKYKGLHDRRGQADVNREMGILYRLTKRPEMARKYFEDSLKVSHEDGDSIGERLTRHELGLLDAASGE